MEFEPIILKYDGLDADDHRLDLYQIAQSLQGAAQLLGTAASIVSTGEYAKRASTMSVKIMAGAPRAGSWEIPAIIVSVLPATTPDLFAEFGKALATKVTTKIVNYVVSSFDEKKSSTEIERALDTVQKAVAELGYTSRHAVDAVVRMSAQQQASVKALVVPVGLSCETMQVGDKSNGAIKIDRSLRELIDAPVAIDVDPAERHEIMISEMDRLNQSCKFAFRGDENSDKRLTGVITDPIIQVPGDPYSAAFSEQLWITVVGKLQRKAGDPDRLFISDIVRS